MEKSKRVRDFAVGSSIIDKAQVLQDARQCFMATSVKAKKLIDILTKCIIILLGDEQLFKSEATDLFFHTTRLFQYKDKDTTLRRLTYIAIKALSQQADNIYVVTPSLTNDLNSISDPAIRASALRALCRISDAATFSSIEQYIKQGIVNKHSVIASAAITSLIRNVSINTDYEIVRRCKNEIQAALNSDSPMVQYHALGLLYNFCKNDQQELSSLINNCIQQQGLRSPFAICLLIRMISEFIGSDHNNNDDEAVPYREYIESNLNHRDELVEYEAAKALVSRVSNEHKSALAHLRNFLTSDKLALRFASVRLLNELSTTSSQAIRFWSVHRIGGVCKLHLLNKRYRLGDHIIGLLDFTNANLTCAKYTVILQCEETQQFELKQEFSLGLRRSDIMITIPNLINTKQSVLHCVLSFLFYIADENYSKTLFEDRAGAIELGPGELDTKLFSCDFPIVIHT